MMHSEKYEALLLRVQEVERRLALYDSNMRAEMPAQTYEQALAAAEAEIAFLTVQVRRAMCGCVAKDCTVHGAFAPEDWIRLSRML